MSLSQGLIAGPQPRRPFNERFRQVFANIRLPFEDMPVGIDHRKARHSAPLLTGIPLFL